MQRETHLTFSTRKSKCTLENFAVLHPLEPTPCETGSLLDMQQVLFKQSKRILHSCLFRRWTTDRLGWSNRGVLQSNHEGWCGGLNVQLTIAETCKSPIAFCQKIANYICDAGALQTACVLTEGHDSAARQHPILACNDCQLFFGDLLQRLSS